MERSTEMHSGMEATTATVDVQGLTGWVLGLLRSWRGQSGVQQKQMQLVETLSLGGKRQLMLVSCGGERFLVGGGLESVETIVRVKTEGSPEGVAKNLDEICG
jgi:flagellar biogenesis protein FliO